jgi:VWFA-related protein
VGAVRVAALLAAVSISAPRASGEDHQQFKAGTELVAVEVSVLDGNGDPVPDLGAGDFTVQVGGRRRTITTVQFIRTEPGPPPAPREVNVSSNQRVSSGRLLLLVVDESNLRPGTAMAAVRAAEALLRRLSPGDLVGVTRIPNGGGVEFTADRSKVAEVLAQVTGSPPRPRTSRVTVFISEAADYEDTRRIQWPAALKRECGEPTAPGYAECAGAMELEAIGILREEELKRGTVVSTLARLIRSLGSTGQPVTMVVMSQGLFVGRDPGALSGLASAAATARVALHVVRPLTSDFDVAGATLSSDPRADNAAWSRGLETLAAQFNGGFHEVSSTGAATFDRIGRELSGYYLLGIEPADEDRTARPRALRVSVARPGVTVRARRNFLAVAESLPAADPSERLRQMLKAATPLGGLPMKLTSMVVSGDDDKHVRVLVSAEIGEAIARDAAYRVGLLAIGPRGDVVTSSGGTLTLSPSRTAAPAPALFSTSLVLARGDYSIRLAAIAPDGRSGSVHHAVRASLNDAGRGFLTSDVIVAAEPPPNRFPLFNASGVVDGPRVAALLEVAHADPHMLDGCTVRFDVEGRSFDAGAGASVTSSSRTRRTFAVASSLDLPRGEYIMRATVTPKTGDPFTLVRPFLYEPEMP